jgi:hypothetical protein
MVALLPVIGVVAQEIDTLIAFNIHDSKYLSMGHYVDPVSACWNDFIGYCGFHRIASRSKKSRSPWSFVLPNRDAITFVYSTLNIDPVIADYTNQRITTPYVTLLFKIETAVSECLSKVRSTSLH